MTRLTGRKIVRALRAPGGEPPADLARKIKEAIPEDLFAARGREAATSSRRRTRGRAQWAIAASVAVAIGSGYLAVRLFDEQREAVPESIDRLAPAVASRPAEPRTRSSGPLEGPEQAEAVNELRDSIPPAPATLPPAANVQRPEDEVAMEALGALRSADSAAADSAAAQSTEPEAAVAPEPALEDLDAASFANGAARARTENERIAAENQSIEVQNEKIQQLEDEKRKLEKEMLALPQRQQENQRRMAALRSDARAAAVFDAPASRRADPDRGGFLDVATHPVSTVAVTVTGRSLAAAIGGEPDSAAAVPLEEILDDAAQPRGAAPRDAITVEGGPARTAGHVVVLFSAVLAESDPGGAATPPPGTIEVELDPAAARSYRLLASHAHSLAPAPAEVAANPERLYRVTALYEIELARDRRPGGALGSVRLRHGDAAGAAATTAPLAIGGADLADDWDETRADLRLAVLAAELALLPPDAPAARLAPIERELERMVADSSLDAASARRAAELLSVLRR